MEEEEDNSSSDESFHYPTASSPTSTARAASIRSHATSDYFHLGASTSRASSSRGGTVDLTPHLSQAPEFRVPTHEAPQKVTPRWTPPAPHSMQPLWERDDAAPDCRNCKRRFTFLLRKHVGTTKSRLAAEYSLYYTSTAENVARSSATDARPIELCWTPRTLFKTPYTPTRLRIHQRFIEFVMPATNKSPPMYLVGSKAYARGLWRESWLNLRRCSEFREIDRSRPRRLATLLSKCKDSTDPNQKAHFCFSCPVCSLNLAELGPPAVQEAHVKNCLDGPSDGPGVNQAGRYLVYKLPAGSALIGVECESARHADTSKIY